VDKVTGPLPVPPEIVEVVPDLLHAILDPVIGPSPVKSRGQPLDDVVKHLVPGKTSRAEATGEAGVDGASDSEDSSSQAEVSTPTAPGNQDAPTAAASLSSPTDCSSQPSPRGGPVRRQEPEASNGESGAPLDPNSSADSPPPPAPSGSGADAGGTAGGDVSCSG
jgi:hypothetical protein